MKTLFVFTLTLFTAFTSHAQTAPRQINVNMLCENAEWRVKTQFTQAFLVDAQGQAQLRSFTVLLSIPKYQAEAQNDKLEAEGHKIPEAVFVDERPTQYSTNCSAYSKTLLGCNVMELNSTTSGYKIRLKTTGAPQEEGKEEIPTGEIISWSMQGESEPLPLVCQPYEVVEVK